MPKFIDTQMNKPFEPNPIVTMLYQTLGLNKIEIDLSEYSKDFADYAADFDSYNFY